MKRKRIGSLLMAVLMFFSSVSASAEDSAEILEEAAGISEEGNLTDSDEMYADLSVSEDTIIYSDTAAGNLSVTNGTLDLNGNSLTVDGLSFTGGTLNLNGGTLTVTGDVVQSGGTMKINGGELIINGDYLLQASDGQNSSGILNMTNESDRVTVSGDFFMQSNKSHKGLLTDGTLKIGGDFTQTFGAYYNYYTSGNHATVFNGTEAQTVTIKNSSLMYEHFNNLKIENTSAEGVVFKQNVFVTGMLMNTESVFEKEKLYLSDGGYVENGFWHTDLYINGNVVLKSDLTINGSLNLKSGTLDLNGYTLNVRGDVLQPAGTMKINGGKLLIDGDYSIVHTNTSYGKLNMTAPDSYVFVGGDFTTESKHSHSGILTEGILEVKGNFAQKMTYNDANFAASGNHKVILSGEQKQTITFDSENSQFNILEITKSLENGYEFSREPLWNELIELSTDSTAPSKPENLKAENASTSAITLKWDVSTDNVAVSGYYVYSGDALIADVASPEYVHEKLTSNTVYTYYIIAYDVERNLSEKSDPLTVSTLSLSDAPTAPSDLKAEVTEEGIKISWSASDSPNLTGYKVYRDGVFIATVTGISYLDEGIEPGVYTYYVRACDDAGNLSNITDSVSADNEPPAAPCLMLEEISDTSVKLTWSVEALDVDYFMIYENNKYRSRTPKNTFTINNLSASELYEYYIVAYDRSGNPSAPSETAAFCSEDTEPPVVSSISPSFGKHSGKVKFIVKAVDNVAVSNVVLQASKDKSTWSDIDSVSSYVRARTITASFNADTALYADGKLYVRAIAYDKNGNASNPDDDVISEISVNNTKPQRPDPISIQLKEGYIEVNWGYPDPDTQYFKLYRSVGDGFELFKDNYRYNNYFEEDLEIGVEFSYYVTAVNSYGCESLPSETVKMLIEKDDTLPEVLSVYPPTSSYIKENQKISVSCEDNLMLKGVSVRLGLPESEELTEIFYGELDDSHVVTEFEFDTEGLSDGEYKLQFVAVDNYGNEGKPYTVFYNYKSCKLSEPELTAEGKGWRNDLNWTMSSSEDLAGYIVYRKDSYYGSYSIIAMIKGSSYSDGQVTAGEKYWYIIGAVDNRNNVVFGPEVCVVPLDEDDIAPTAYAGIDLYTVAGKEVQFNGTKSFDNRNRIESYEWDFGDGAQGKGANAVHTYSEEGSYTAVLKVTDTAGNSHTDAITVNVRDYSFCMADFSISSEGGVRLGNVMVYCEGNGVTSESYYSDSKGAVSIFALPGRYDVYFCKDGYLPVHKEIDITDDMDTISVAMEEKELITGELTVKELKLAEMKALNIDIYAPENQHVFEYTTTIEHKEGDGIEALVFYVNKEGELVNSERSYTFTDSNGRTSKMFVHIITNEEFAKIESMPTVAVLTVTSGFSWTKEFFDVELTVINNASEEFSIENSFATLNLPVGLSIADTYLGIEATRQIGTINGGSSKSISWIVRGDTAGEYDLSADFSGILMPFNTSVTASFETKEPLVVEAGEALYFEEVRGMIEDWEHWSITYRLTNVSEDTVYGISASVGGYIGFGSVDDVMIIYPNGRIVFLAWNKETEEYIEEEAYFDALNYSEDDGRDYLEPGESIIIYLTLDLELTEE